MTSHYMECTVESSFKDVFRALSDYFGNVYSRKFGKKDELHKGVILGEEYFFRTTSSAAILIVLEEHSPNKTKIQAISTAGGTGLLGLSSGVHSAYVHKVKSVLLECDFKIRNEKELSNFSGSS